MLQIKIASGSDIHMDLLLVYGDLNLLGYMGRMANYRLHLVDLNTGVDTRVIENR